MTSPHFTDRELVNIVDMVMDFHLRRRHVSAERRSELRQRALSNIRFVEKPTRNDYLVAITAIIDEVMGA